MCQQFLGDRIDKFTVSQQDLHVYLGDYSCTTCYIFLSDDKCESIFGCGFTVPVLIPSERSLHYSHLYIPLPLILPQLFFLILLLGQKPMLVCLLVMPPYRTKMVLAV